MSTAKYIIASTFLGKGIMPSRLIKFPEYTNSASATKDLVIFMKSHDQNVMGNSRRFIFLYNGYFSVGNENREGYS